MTQSAQAFADHEVDLLEKIVNGQADLAAARGINDDEIEAIYSISYNLYQQHNFDRAEKIFSFLCLYRHLDTRFWIGLAACREGLGQFQKAIEAYSYATLLEHDNPLPPVQAARCYLALNNTEQARMALEAAIHWSETKPQHHSTLTKAQTMLLALNQKTIETEGDLS